MNNYGYQNEYDFVELFNNKCINELDNNSKAFLKELFGELLIPNEKLICWKNRMQQKSDIHIKYRNYIKNISLKCGKSNSMHSENFTEFKRYLENLGIPYNIIEKYIDYHFGYKRDENGKLDFSKTLSSDEYKELYQEDIDEFNRCINKTRIIVDMIDRFVVRGKNSDYDIDALVVGTVDDYVWIMKYDLYDLILADRGNYHTSPHIACMTIGPKKRNLDRNSKNPKDRYLICVRWNFIRERIIEYKKGLI